VTTPFAIALCLLFIVWLFRIDLKRPEAQAISWAPLVWMFLAGSRWASSWLNLSGPLNSVDAYAEGSPVDRAVFFALIVWGVVVLVRRRIDWRRVFGRNSWLALYLLFCLSSILWTDDAFILVKRWFKDLGNPIMVLVLLTEDRPYYALTTTLRRLAFLLLPLSALFVRYLPELGRAYHPDGSPMYTGVGHQKNDLGLMCLTAGLYLAWKLLHPRTSQLPVGQFDRYDVVLAGLMAWLLRMSDSQTSFACLVAAIAVLLIARMPIFSRRPARIVPCLIWGVLAYVALDAAVGVRDHLLMALGRDPSLTNRTELWDVVRMQRGSAWVGTGFMSFWTGDRMQAIWDALGGGINQAHNGYLEQYVNLGIIGVLFIIVLMVITLMRIWRQLPGAPAIALLRLCLLVCAILYNYTEASFYGINNMWVLLLAASIEPPAAVAAAPARVTPAHVGRPRLGHWVASARTRPGTVASPISRGRVSSRNPG
jgi:O-antigen ligase